MSTTVRIDPEVGVHVFRARLIIQSWRPGRVTANEALRVLLAVNNLHRVGLVLSPPAPDVDPVDPPCQGATT